MSNQPNSYRPEIDGLRAIAVLSVVLYHFGVPGLRGGFVGVDIFFVISGYLIGGLLWRELQDTGRIALGAFYVRRIRRLAPAFVAMAIASTIAGYFILLPFEYREFGKSLIAATIYLSNLHFYRETGYFDGAAEDKTLLHTWSLSVEEQFYIALPLMIVLLSRWTGFLRAVLWVSFAASLVACILVTPSAPTATFFLFPFRAWEMLAGVLLAVETQRKGGFGPMPQIVSWAGIVLVIFSLAWITPETAFPGWVAILPVLGTLCILANGTASNPVNTALRMRGPVAIGLISYSLYLWHWPVFTLAHYARGSFSGPVESGAWIVLSFALAYASWRFIERPFRTSQNPKKIRVFGGAFVVSLALIAFGGVIFKRDGMIERFDSPLRAHIEASADFLQDWSRCYVPSSGPFWGVDICPIGPDTDAPKVLIWGDSHVRALKEGLDLAAHEAGVAALLIWRAGCAPLFDLAKVESTATPAENAGCFAANEQVKRALTGETQFENLLLIGRWAYYANGQGIGVDAHNTIDLSHGSATGQNAFQAAAQQSLTQMTGLVKHVSLLKQIPEIADYDSRKIARALAGHRMEDVELQNATSVSIDAIIARQTPLSEFYASVQAAGADLIDPAPEFCTKTECSALYNQTVQYFDNNHIVNAAARRIRHLFDPIWQIEGAQ